MTDYRNNFPYFNGMNPIYLDSAATTQKPKVVLHQINDYYSYHNSNVHRANYPLAELSTQRYEWARKQIADYVGVNSNTIAFTHGTTDSINTLARCISHTLSEDSIIVLTELEHHSNILPWMALPNKKIFVTINEFDELDLEYYENILKTENVGFIAVTHISNSLGIINPIKTMVKLAHQHGHKIFVDGAQAVGKISVDLLDLDVDFYAFGSHKMYGPNGLGVLYVKDELKHLIDPQSFGGGMTGFVDFSGFDIADFPHRMEAGTPDYVGAYGFGIAAEWLSNIDIVDIESNLSYLSNYLINSLRDLTNIKIVGNPNPKSGIVSMISLNEDPMVLSKYLGKYNICIRGGSHCNQPLMRKLGITGTMRVSLGLYSNQSDIDILIETLKNIKLISL